MRRQETNEKEWDNMRHVTFITCLNYIQSQTPKIHVVHMSWTFWTQADFLVTLRLMVSVLTFTLSSRRSSTTVEDNDQYSWRFADTQSWTMTHLLNWDRTGRSCGGKSDWLVSPGNTSQPSTSLISTQGTNFIKVVSLLSTDRRDAASGQTQRHIRMLLLQLLIRLSQITQNLFVLVLMWSVYVHLLLTHCKRRHVRHYELLRDRIWCNQRSRGTRGSNQ